MEIGAFEAKNSLGILLDRVEQGEEIVITRHGKRVARLIPDAPVIDTQRARAALDRIRARAGSSKGGFNWPAVKEDRESGRP